MLDTFCNAFKSLDIVETSLDKATTQAQQLFSIPALIIYTQLQLRVTGQEFFYLPLFQ